MEILSIALGCYSQPFSLCEHLTDRAQKVLETTAGISARRKTRAHTAPEGTVLPNATPSRGKRCQPRQSMSCGSSRKFQCNYTSALNCVPFNGSAPKALLPTKVWLSFQEKHTEDPSYLKERLTNYGYANVGAWQTFSRQRMR